MLRLSPDLFDMVRDTSLVNAEFRYSKAGREVFLAILEKKGDVARVLRQMHRCDFLGRYMPEFGALTLRIQNELFHHYAADEHTLRCIDHLDDLAANSRKAWSFTSSFSVRCWIPRSFTSPCSCTTRGARRTRKPTRTRAPS